MFRKFWEPVGYYPFYGDVYGESFCENCAPIHADGKCSADCCDPWTLEEAEPVFHWSESDVPVNCVDCEETIGITLTPSGEDYVRMEHELAPTSTTREWVKVYQIELSKDATQI
jgi:hypothetical protein